MSHTPGSFLSDIERVSNKNRPHLEASRGEEKPSFHETYTLRRKKKRGRLFDDYESRPLH